MQKRKREVNMLNFKKLITNIRVIILLCFIVMAVLAIYPNPYAKGVAIRSVVTNSSASLAGIQSPLPTTRPMSREVITSVNNKPVNNLEDYYNVVSSLTYNRTVVVKTNRQSYVLATKPLLNVTVLNETEVKVVEETIEVNVTINGTTGPINKTVNVTKTVPKTKIETIGTEDIGLRVYDAPTSNIIKGLDLQGGTRVLLAPEGNISDDEMEILLDNMAQRLNVYGLSDIIIRKAGDLSGNKYILVEIAGANEEEVQELLSRQGKFEAKIGENTIFRGGQDITYVCRSSECSYAVDPQKGCWKISGEENWGCTFSFSITLSPEAAQRQADFTKDLGVVTQNGERYLNETLALYLDDKEVDSLNIASDLKGRAVTDIQISGSGIGASRQEAAAESGKNMKKLQTILITGSLPVKLKTIKTDSISPVLGKQFISNAFLVGLLAVISVAVVIFIRYRQIKVAAPMILTVSLEVFLLLGLAAIIGWNLDLAAIAGIIAAIGTGVDDQIVITDEVLRGEKERMAYDWKKRIKNAFFVIFTAYFATVAAMIPLGWAGAGLLRGFAFTTIAGVSIGVFLTRPAYAVFVEFLLKE